MHQLRNRTIQSTSGILWVWDVRISLCQNLCVSLKSSQCSGNATAGVDDITVLEKILRNETLYLFMKTSKDGDDDEC